MREATGTSDLAVSFHALAKACGAVVGRMSPVQSETQRARKSALIQLKMRNHLIAAPIALLLTLESPEETHLGQEAKDATQPHTHRDTPEGLQLHQPPRNNATLSAKPPVQPSTSDVLNVRYGPV